MNEPLSAPYNKTKGDMIYYPKGVEDAQNQ